MEEEVRNYLKENLKDLASGLELLIQEKENDPFSQTLKNFAQEVSQVSGGKITLKEKEADFSFPGFPALTLSSNNRQNIHYLVLPEAHELPPFIQSLKLFTRGEALLSTQARNLLNKVSNPAEIWVFVSPSCSNCPRMVKAVVALAMANPLLSAFIIDVQHFNKLAEEYDLKSVPATIIDRKLVLLGEVSEEKLAELIAQRGTLSYEREMLRTLIERSRTKEAAEILSQGKGGEAILSLFQEGDLSMRIGVLVVFEEILEKYPGALKEMVPSLIELLAHKDSRIRGDIADLLGKIGDPRAIPYLEQLTADPDPDVADAACEALEMIKGT